MSQNKEAPWQVGALCCVLIENLADYLCSTVLITVSSSVDILM